MRITSQLTAFIELPVGTFCRRAIASPLLFYDHLLIHERAFVHFGLFRQYATTTAACDAESYPSNWSVPGFPICLLASCCTLINKTMWLFYTGPPRGSAMLVCADVSADLRNVFPKTRRGKFLFDFFFSLCICINDSSRMNLHDESWWK